ncbi:Epsin-2 [Trichoplax sp. H2]|nr:Epsin-2 [Trichoplax sp. H2]|eukprot:RDD37390.1 Epsin-2 [Trichoplax sp. H2]
MPITRSFKNVVYNYTDVQRKVREATSNDPWGPSSTIMTEIADATYNMSAFQEIMDIVWKRLNDHGKNWRHVYKALTLLEYIIKTGSDRVTQNCRENIFAIQTLKDFQFIDKDNKDQGLNVREKAKHLVALLKDDERLKEEREKALKAKERFIRASGQTGKPVMQTPPSNPTSQQITFHPTTTVVGVPVSVAYPPPLPAQAPAPAPAPVAVPTVVSANTTNAVPSSVGITTVDSVISDAPSTAAEEEMQLNLALAMSRQAAQDHEKRQLHEDQQLKKAINESILVNQQNQTISNRGTVGGDPWSSGANSFPAVQSQPPSVNMQSNALVDPWGSAASSIQSTGNITQPQTSAQVTTNDPWSAPPASSQALVTNKDPWSTQPANPVQTSVSNTDLWSAQPAQPLNQTAATTSDPWSSNNIPVGNVPTQASVSQSVDPFQQQTTANPQLYTDQWSSNTEPPIQSVKAAAAPSLNNNQPVAAANDPWATQNETSAPSQSDPWQSKPSAQKDELDDFASLRLTNPSASEGADNTNNASILTPMNINQVAHGDTSNSSSKLKDAKSFLGENSSLVNLETLVVNAPVADGMSTNPFQNSSNQRPQNPFCQPQQRPSMNQLRNTAATGMSPMAPGIAPVGSTPYDQPMQPFPAQNFTNPF